MDHYKLRFFAFWPLIAIRRVIKFCPRQKTIVNSKLHVPPQEARSFSLRCSSEQNISPLDRKPSFKGKWTPQCSQRAMSSTAGLESLFRSSVFSIFRLLDLIKAYAKTKTTNNVNYLSTQPPKKPQYEQIESVFHTAADSTFGNSPLPKFFS